MRKAAALRRENVAIILVSAQNFPLRFSGWSSSSRARAVRDRRCGRMEQRKLHRIAGAGRVARHLSPSACSSSAVLHKGGDLQQPTGQRRGALRGTHLSSSQRTSSSWPGSASRATRHPVLRQRSGLVGEDHAGRTQRLDRGQPFDQRVAPRHAPHAARQRHPSPRSAGPRGRGPAHRQAPRRRLEQSTPILAAPRGPSSATTAATISVNTTQVAGQAVQPLYPGRHLFAHRLRALHGGRRSCAR